jgi:hypothetical protein
MNRAIRSAAVAGVSGALLLLAAPASHAATTVGPCVSATASNARGDGQITVCPQSDGTAHVTGYVENLQAWTPFDNTSRVAWMINLANNGGSLSPTAAAVYGKPSNKVVFDYSFTPAAPVTGETLDVAVWM